MMMMIMVVMIMIMMMLLLPHEGSVYQSLPVNGPSLDNVEMLSFDSM